eukprot:m.4548 g.4548  ORF g.4548 m.4548 type:complete len:669 (-) comp3013_c0_seq2:114-2120(-)
MKIWDCINKDEGIWQLLHRNHIYTGGRNGPHRHGHGRELKCNGDCYIGEWKNDQQSGQGEMWYKNKDHYKGEWENDMRHGQGEMTYATGDVYIGEWRNNMSNGQGKNSFGNGDVYTGTWKDDMMHGDGEMKYANGNVYVGEWKNGEINGRGKMTFPNGEMFHGEWKEEKSNGKGKYIFENGDVYVGEWKDDMMFGEGKMKFANGNVYKGKWKNDERNGHGKMRYNDGDIYVGEWKSDKMHGFGSLQSTDHYVGEWKEGKKHGQGKIHFESRNGEIYSGEWKNNQAKGIGKYVYSNGDVYTGEVTENKNIVTRHGYGKMVNSNGTIKTGIWENNKLSKNKEKKEQKEERVAGEKNTGKKRKSFLLEDGERNPNIKKPAIEPENPWKWPKNCEAEWKSGEIQNETGLCQFMKVSINNTTLTPTAEHIHDMITTSGPYNGDVDLQSIQQCVAVHSEKKFLSFELMVEEQKVFYRDVDGKTSQNQRHPKATKWDRNKVNLHRTLEYLEQYCSNRQLPTKLKQGPKFLPLLVYHGLKSGDMKEAMTICETGLRVMCKRNKGWFGKGVYFTPDLDYAIAYANDGGGGIVIAYEIALFQPCPVDSTRVNGKALTELSDAHVVIVRHGENLDVVSTKPIRDSTLWKTKHNPEGERVSCEIVVREGSHALPRFILKL